MKVELNPEDMKGAFHLGVADFKQWKHCEMMASHINELIAERLEAELEKAPKIIGYPVHCGTWDSHPNALGSHQARLVDVREIE